MNQYSAKEKKCVNIYINTVTLVKFDHSGL